MFVEYARLSPLPEAVQKLDLELKESVLSRSYRFRAISTQVVVKMSLQRGWRGLTLGLWGFLGVRSEEVAFQWEEFSTLVLFWSF